MAVKAVLETLRHVWLTIDELGITAAVVGGLALAFWKHPRATRDVDVMVSVTDAQLEELVNALVNSGVRLKGEGARVHLGNTDIVQLEYEPPEAFVDVPLDLLIARSQYAREALQRSITVTLEQLGLAIRVLGCEDLIINKLLAGRIIDLADAAALVRANIGSLDMEYLKDKVDQLQLSRQLRKIWEEACPGEPFP